ncbi:MAG: site-specific DNA-methyltransferase, partial [Planctomycetaceae bacterium]|nr:site-specific DNA-methyltransferase [Planctomycetaceae bacterium]
MTPQNSKSNKNKINSGGLKSAIAHNNSVKPNSNLIQILKIALPQFFDSDKKFQTDKFLTELQENNIAESRDGYKLGFVGKDYARLQTGCKPETMIAPDIKHNSRNENKNSENIFITGDNLEVLRHMQNAYVGKIKMIYIDPPYNTGKEFVYNDTFEFNDEKLKSMLGYSDDEIQRLKLIQGKSSHSAWLTFMYPRLKLAQKLLTDDGVIFVSIDDNEQANLKMLMDDIFGEGNFVNQFAWVNNITGRQISGYGAAKTYEYVLVYAKNIFDISEFYVDIAFAKKNIPDTYKGFQRDVRKDEYGEFAVGDTLYNHNRIFNEETRPNLVFSIFYNPDTGDITHGNIGEKKKGYIEILPHKNGDGSHKYHAWRWSRNKIETDKYDLIVLPTNNNDYEIYTKTRSYTKTLLKDLITNVSNGDTEFRQLFNEKKIFDYPKPTILLMTFLRTQESNNIIILDFFAGSGTTAHAVMQLNAEDGGNRKFILVQIDEPTNPDSEARRAGYKTIDEIARERIKLATKKIKSEKELVLSENFDGGFKHYRIVTPDVTTLDKIEK